MAQTLETIATAGASPIPNNSASSKSFANDYFKLQVPNLSTRSRLVIWILALVYELAHNGGTNYKTNHAGLIQDSQVYTGGIPKIDLISSLTADAWSGGNQADATLSNSIPSLLQEGHDLLAKSEEELARMIIFLSAQPLV